MKLWEIVLDAWGLVLLWIARCAGVVGMVIVPIATTAQATEDIIKGVSAGAMLIVIALILGTVGTLLKEKGE